MPHRGLANSVAVAVLALALGGVSNALGAFEGFVFNQLSWQFAGQLSAGKFEEAEKTVLAMLRLAEGPLREDPSWLASALIKQGNLRREQGRYAEAEQHYQRSLEIREKLLGPEHLDVATTLNNLGVLYSAQARYAEAQPLYQRALAIREKLLPPTHKDVGQTLNNLAVLYQDQARYAEAEPLLKRALEIWEKARGPEHPDVAVGLSNVAELQLDQGRYAEAESLYQRALAIREKALGPEHPEVGKTLGRLALLRDIQGLYAEGERLHQRALTILEKALGPDHPEVSKCLDCLALSYVQQGRYAEAEPLYQRDLAISEKTQGPAHPDLGSSLNNLALLYVEQGRHAEAEAAYRRAITITEKALGPAHPRVAPKLDNLSSLYVEEGRYAEAEPLSKRALAISEKALGPDHPKVGTVLANLATLYACQKRYAEAEPLYQRALGIAEKALGVEHPDFARRLNSLGVLYWEQKQYGKAEPLLKRALAIAQSRLGPEHLLTATVHNSLGTLYTSQARYAEAEPLCQQALAVYEKIQGPNHPALSVWLNNLAMLYRDQGRLAEAEQRIDRAVALLKAMPIDPVTQLQCQRLRAELSWKAGRRDAALADLGVALDLAEQLRGRSSGSEHQQAAFFGSYAVVYEEMVEWQADVGHVAEALAAMERSRARALLDQMQVQGVDLLQGIPAEQAQRLRAAERDSQQQVASVEKRIQLLAQRKELSADQRQHELATLEGQLRQAQQAYVNAHADIRNASPAYRLAVGTDRKPVSLGRLQKLAAAENALVLEYLVGDRQAYVLVVPGNAPARIERISVGTEQAGPLGIEPGPLTAARLAQVFSNAQDTGLLQRLRRAATAEATGQAVPGLAALWELLVPEAERTAMTARQYRRLVVFPDAALAQLPFETLVVRRGTNPQYLLDLDLPTEYAPSATIFVNLAERQAQAQPDAREPVLTVGHPQYASSPDAPPQDLANQLATRSRYSIRGGSLAPLPFTAWETDWVRDVFGDAGIAATQLKGDQATKAAVLSQGMGRRILHLACHGLVDQGYGNLFGALALTPGSHPDDSADDGFLTVAEIYGLRLTDCELTILSACDTNVGPEQRGEGVWALSRGFLVAGARRVVASNWLVDDEAAASLVSVFCNHLAIAEKEGKPPDYAQALHAAKLWVRQEEKWRQPYYWGTFVLLGPK